MAVGGVCDDDEEEVDELLEHAAAPSATIETIEIAPIRCHLLFFRVIFMA